MKRRVRSVIATFTGLVMTMSLTLVAPVGAAETINYNIWSLQQPDGTTISNSQLAAGYSSTYFYVNGNSRVFKDTQTGVTTSGSLHPRSELREVTTSGANAAWTWDGTNTMTVGAMVTLQGGGTSGKTTIGQVYNSTDSIPLCEIEYTATKNASGGNLQLLYEEAKGAGTYIYLSNVIALNQAFTYKFSLTNGSLNVYVNGVKAYSKTPSFSGKKFYFKCGNYDQTAVAGAVTTTSYTKVELSSVAVVHN